ncbi:MAG: alanine--glyoxylate aminotransferase family protein [Planctomycetes bacterium]|nr:alanine--glyoxylate aminotransferase family protein [Planctomycetota bacterium]
MHKRLFIPGPVEVDPEILQACAVPMFGHRSKEYETLHGAVKSKLRKFFGTEKGNVFLFTSSSTGAMEACLRNLAGKRVLSCACGAFSERWGEMAPENGKENDVYAVEWGEPNRPEEIDRRLASGKYDCITLVYNETSTGVMNPLAETAAVMAKYPDVSFCVDAVSAMAGVPIEPGKLGIDVVLAGTQKAFGLPPGLAVAWVSDRAIEKAKKIPARGHYFDFLQLKKYDEKNQTPETPAISLIHALDVQLDRFFREGLDARWARHRAMAESCRAWADRHFKMFPEKGYESVTLSCIENTRKIDVKKLNDELGKRGAVISDGYGKIKDRTFRIAHMADTKPEDLKQLLGWIDEILKL